MTKKTNTNIKDGLSTLDKFLDKYLVKKAPAIPKDIKEIIVKYSPYLIILSILSIIPSVLAILGLNTLSLPFKLFSRLSFGYTLSTIILLTRVILYIIALPGLFKRQAKSWKYLYYSVLISTLHSVLYFHLVNFLIGTVLSLYVLFQIKSHYK